MNNTIEENCEVNKNTMKFKLPRKKEDNYQKSGRNVKHTWWYKNANKNNNGIWFVTMQIANCQSSKRKLIYTKFSLQVEGDKLENECFSSVVKA